MKTIMTAAAALAAAFWLGGCTEIAQEPGKSYAGDQFKGDKAKWEVALAERSQKQDDYARIPAADKK